MAEAWSLDEVDRTIDTYFAMLSLELDGQSYNKSEHRRRLMQHVGRKDAAIEFKFQNISAALIELGAVPIVGYKPARNMQGLLRERVAQRFSEDADVRQQMRTSVTAEVTGTLALLPAPVQPPVLERMPQRRLRIARSIDFQAIEAANRELGHAGEVMVLEAERRRLRGMGLERLARDVEHVSQTQGDGLGFDILSFNHDGSERFLEVKTTRSSEYQPFLVSRNEVELSEEEPDKFALVRVFRFEREKVGCYELAGSLLETADLRGETFSGRPAS